MLVDKPEWVKHEGNKPIWSIDIDHEGQRVVTAGADNKIRIWAAAPILSANAEVNAAQPKVLATLSDHMSPVNVARFCPVGHVVASGSDDSLVLLFRLQAGQGKVTFGSKDAPNVENWRLSATMRGHSSNIVDLTWCPDGTKLATCSLDNLVIVWDAATGRQITQLNSHYGHVKGVSWDPFNHFLASQGETDGIFIWSTTDWALIAKVQEPYKNSVASHSFHARLNWSPDGQTLVGTNALSLNTQQAPMIKRNTWDAPYQLCGHKRPICVVRHNPRMFYKRHDAGSDQACAVCAVGSGDMKFTVWSGSESKPLMVGKDFFGGCVMDLAWTPDGYTLMVCSYDGTIAVVTFTETELGRRLPDADMTDLLQQLYGDQRKRGETLVSDASLMALELSTQGTGSAVAVVQARTLPGLSSVAASALNARLGPAGGAAASFQPASGAAGAAAAARDVAGKKRLAPTPVGDPAAAPLPVTSTAPRPVSQVPQAAPRQSTQNGGPPPAKRMAPTPVAASALVPARTASLQAVAAPVQGVMVTGTGQGSSKAGPVVAVPTVTAHHLSAPPVQGMLSVCLGSRPSPNAIDTSGTGGFGEVVVTVEAVNNLSDRPGGPPMARIQCCAAQPGHTATETMWFDMVQGRVVLLTGSLNFVAAVVASGDLLVFSAAGRRMFPPISLGGPAAFVAHDRGWQLLVLSVDGQLRVWNLEHSTCVLDVSLSPVLNTCNAEVTAVQLASTGKPLVLLSNHHTYTYMEGMKTWVRIADDAFPGSQFHSLFAGGQGELGRVQASAAAARSHADVIAASMQPAAVQARASRAHLESNMAAALALRSSKEWKNWLVIYVRQLSGDGDEARLREVIHDLLGPVRWSPASHPALPDQHQAQPGGAGAGGWTPSVLGYNKRSLLRNEVLKILSRNRSAVNQRLMQDTLDLLKEADACWPPEQQLIGHDSQIHASPLPGVRL